MGLEVTESESDLAQFANGLELIAVRALSNLDDAQDVVQETLTRALLAVRRGDAERYESLGALVYGIARHVISDVLRSNRKNLPLVGDPPGSSGDTLQALVKNEDKERTLRALTMLRSDDRQLLRKCFVEGMRLKEIASEMGEPPERIRKRKSRALKRLRDVLANDVKSHKPTPNAISK